MAWLMGDSFDFYTTAADAGTHWDSINVGIWDMSAAGRFTGSRCLINNTSSSVQLTKSSGSNDATHHIVCSFVQTATISGSSLGEYFQFLDATTGQCCIVFRSDGAILLTSGTPGGTVLATYTGAFTQSVWNGFEFEVTIHPSAGVFKVRKNGNSSDDFSATGLVTRVSANSYANKLQIGNNTSSNVVAAKLDDIIWFNTSGAAPNTWVGDIRAAQLMPSGDSSVQFSKAAASYVVTPTTAAVSQVRASGAVTYNPFTASHTGTIATATCVVATGGTGNLKAAIYDSTLTTVLGTSNAVVNPGTGTSTITFASPVSVTKNAVYYLAIDQDFSITYTGTSSGGNQGTLGTTAYASFPASPATTTGTGGSINTSVTIVPTNADLVSDTTQDGLTTYVYDSTVGHTDLYNMTDLPTNTATIIGIQTRAFMEKSDTGARTGRIQLKSGGTTSTHDLALSSSFVWNTMVDTVDPNTSAAWTLSQRQRRAARPRDAGVVARGRFNLEHDGQDQRHADWQQPDCHCVGQCRRGARQGPKARRQILHRIHQHHDTEHF